MPTASLANPSRAKKIHKALNKPEKCPLYDLGKMTPQALPDRLEMLPAADDKSVWDMAPAGLSSGGFFIGAWEGAFPGMDQAQSQRGLTAAGYLLGIWQTGTGRLGWRCCEDFRFNQILSAAGSPPCRQNHGSRG